MSVVYTNRQRASLYKKHGKPILALEFDVFSATTHGLAVSMWAHTRHEIPFEQMKEAFEAIKDHLQRFIDDADMCPFNPEFVTVENL
jgi:hypothetical protein